MRDTAFMRDISQNRPVKAGFRRLWFVISVIWLIVVAYFVVSDADRHFSDWIKVGMLPVVGLYAIFAGLAWVIEGFRSR